MDASELQTPQLQLHLQELLFLFYSICVCFSQSLELSRSNHAPRAQGCPMTDLSLGEESLRVRHMPDFSAYCTLGKCFTHNWASNMHCRIFKSLNLPLEYLCVSKTSSGWSFLNTQFPYKSARPGT